MVDMIDIVKRTMLTGIGLALKSKDEVESVLKDLQNRLDLSETDGRQFMEEFQQKYDEAQAKLESRVEKAVQQFMKKADMVTKDELNALKAEIRELKKAVSAVSAK